jgi:hypothetical protein
VEFGNQSEKVLDQNENALRKSEASPAKGIDRAMPDFAVRFSRK